MTSEFVGVQYLVDRTN